jgi:hypothetical protein
VRCSLAGVGGHGTVRPMRELLILAIHLLVTLVKLLRAVVAESLLLKHQILISNRSRRRASNLTTLDRCVLGLTTLSLSPRRVPKLGALVRPATPFKSTGRWWSGNTALCSAFICVASNSADILILDHAMLGAGECS